MNWKKNAMMWLIALGSMLTANAQTDYTQLITNPSFEQRTEGWEQKGMSVQDNSIFSIKDGTYYMERWTGRGGAVGNAKLSQALRNLPPGNYELTVAAQNIQEDTPDASQTGAWIFAGDIKTMVDERKTYTVSFTFISGSIDIGFEAQNASGNWLAVDNFKLTLVNSNLSKPLSEAITHATTLYGDGSGKKAQQLKDAIDQANAVAAQSDATGQQQADAIIALQEAENIYLQGNANADQPLNMTSFIVNPSFETGNLTGWTTSDVAVQGNDIFNIKNGTYYVEKWTGRGGAVGNALVSQKLTDLPAGRYRLKVAAQNIQEDTPNNEQTGTWLFADSHKEPITVRSTYTLEFVQVADEMTIGFEAKNASGNWLALDNFQLEYISDNFDDIKTEYAALINMAETLVDQRMNATAQQALTEAIATAKPLLSQSTTDGWPAAATALTNTTTTATTSIEVFARLAEAIAAAKVEIADPQATQKADYQVAIDTAQVVYEAETTTDTQAEEAITALTEATFAFKILNGTGSGTAPKVVTDTRFIRGCTWAFGRSTVTGTDLMEEGFCWSEDPDPKVTDNRTTEYINQAGKIYWLRDLKPATIYYMRAYAITKDYAVGYGNVIKFVTVPKGTVGHWYNNAGDEDINARLNYAIDLSMDYYWNNLTSIHGFGISVNYNPGVPTAECSYGGWMSVGASSSYQQPGTIMHEAFHGIGVGTHDIWWNGEMRSAGDRGDWLGDRVTEAVRFWDNNANTVISGDHMHLWPYGCNGAHEDTHNDNLYCMMGILAQALNEDGLPASGEIGYALPYYAFNHEDGVKYYIKNEDESRGLRTSYLIETENHTLQWKTMSAEEAAANDAAAWYLSFTPSNQYYQLRNAASGYYMTYNSGIKTNSQQTIANNFHLMRGRVDVDGHRGYYIIHPESSATPPCLNATANGQTAVASWNIAKSATTQRWLILTAEEALNFDNGNVILARKELTDLLAQIRKLAQTPHREDIENADATLSNALTNIETEAENCTKGAEITALAEQARTEAMTFLSSVSVTDLAQPFNLTFMIENPNFDNNVTTGWTSTNGTPGYDAQGAEFYEKTFDFYQILPNMPSGTYQLHAYAFQRPGAADAIYTPYKRGSASITTSLYIGSTSAPVKHICDDRQPSALFNDGGWGSDKQIADGTYIPNCMVGAEKYFANGLYDSSVSAQLEKAGSSLRIGIKCNSAPTYYWMMFDSFRLYFFGGNDTPVNIRQVAGSHLPAVHSIFDLQGRKISPNAELKSGIYIVGGKKVIVK